VVNQLNLKTVYLISGIDELVQQFHAMPGETKAIIEIKDRTASVTSRRLLRSIASRVRPKKYRCLSRYCKEHHIQHIKIAQTDLANLHNWIAALKADLIVAYRCPSIPNNAINTASLGGINVHFSALPNYHGSDPLLWQVLHGAKEIGVTVHQLIGNDNHGLILEQGSIVRPHNLKRNELRYYVNSHLTEGLLHNSLEKLHNDEPEWKQQACIANAIAAPSKASTFWREYISTNDLDEEHVKDIVAFVGAKPRKESTIP